MRAFSFFVLVVLVGTCQHSRAQSAVGDCPGHDVDCSTTANPAPNKCNPSTIGQTAVCWQNGANPNTPPFQGCSGQPQDWCTYKSTSANSCVGGANPGAIYQCTSMGWQSASTRQAIVVSHEFVAWEAGGFFAKTIKEIGTPQFVAMLEAACLSFGDDCSSTASEIAAGAHYATPYIATGNVRTTAWIDSHNGEEYKAKFAAPNGYTTCRAKIDYGGGSISGGATFNGTIQRMSGQNQDGLGLYVEVPKNRPTGQWVKFRVFVEFVPKGTDLSRCWPDNTVAFQCTGEHCNLYPGAQL